MDTIKIYAKVSFSPIEKVKYNFESICKAEICLNLTLI